MVLRQRDKSRYAEMYPINAIERTESVPDVQICEQDFSGRWRKRRLEFERLPAFPLKRPSVEDAYVLTPYHEL